MSFQNRTVGLTALVFSAVLMQVGSAWLFGVGLAVKVAGPAAIFSWPIGALIMSFIAITVADVSSNFPSMGGVGKYLIYTHGPLSAFVADWAGFLALTLSILAEVIAITQYMSSWPFSWAASLYNRDLNQLSTNGLIVATVLTALLFLINAFSVKALMRSIKGLGYYKIFVIFCAVFIPLITLLPHLHLGNFTAYNHTMAPYGWSNVWTAIAIGGIIPAFIGFQAPVAFAEEAKNPSRNIPLSIMLSMLVSAIIYTALQFSYITSFPIDMIKGNWSSISLQSPFVTLSTILGLHFLTIILYSDAFIAPSTTGIVLMGAAPRTLYGLHETKRLPSFIGKLSSKLIPLNALIIVLVLAVCFLWLVPSWQGVISLLTLCFMVNFLGGPMSAMGLRRHGKELKRIGKMPFIPLFSLLGFVTISLLLIQTGFTKTLYMSIAILIGIAIYIYYEVKSIRYHRLKREIKSSVWILAYMPFISLLTFLFKDIKNDTLSDHIYLLIFSVVLLILYFYWAVFSSRRTPALGKLIYKRKRHTPHF